MPDSEGLIKCLIDTSVLANIQDIHKDSETIWDAILSEIVRGHLKTVRHVMDELERRFPKIFARLHPYRETFLIPDDMLYSVGVVAELRIIQQQHPQLYRSIGGNPADPFLIAAAKELGVIVVTDEKRDGHHSHRRIPWVCAQRNVGCIDRVAYLRDIGCDV